MRPTVMLAGLLCVLVGWGGAAAQDLVPPVANPAAPATQVTPTAADAPVTTAPDGAVALTRQDIEIWLDGYLPYAMARGDIPGAVVVVVKDGEILYEKGFGYADVAARTPVDPATTLFRPGSVSKLFTWTAVMQLVEQGKLDLDADINGYLDFTVPEYDGKPVTLRNILTHTSGIEETARGLITANPDGAIALADYVRDVPTRIFAPGVTPSYSNYATTLAGYIVQRVSGQTFDAYIEEHIFAPLGMRHASFRQPLPASLQPHMSQGYAPGSADVKGFEIVNPAPAGSLSASGSDMGRFMIAHLQKGAFGDARILQAATAETMHGTGLTLLPPLNRMLLGFYEENLNGRRVIAHAGDTQWFHSNLDLFIDDGVGLYVSFNSAGKEGVAGKLRGALLRSFADRYLPGPTPQGSVDAETAKQHAQEIAGVYEISRRADDTFFSLLNLFGQTKVVADGEGGIIVPSWLDLGDQPVKWTEIAPYVWRDANGRDRLAAQVVDGKVVRFAFEPVSPFMVFDRVPAWKSSAWLLPAFVASLAALLLTVIAWPWAYFVRRRHGVAYHLSGRDKRAHRLVRLAALAVLVTMVAVLTALVIMMTNLDYLTPANDWLVRTLRLLALVVFPVGAAVAAWNAWVVLRSRRRRWAKVWAVALALACLVVLYTSVVFHVVGYGTQY